MNKNTFIYFLTLCVWCHERQSVGGCCSKQSGTRTSWSSPGIPSFSWGFGESCFIVTALIQGHRQPRFL